MVEQNHFPAVTDAGNAVQFRRSQLFLPDAAVIGHGKPVGLILDSLEQDAAARKRRQGNNLAIRPEKLSAAFGQGIHGQVQVYLLDRIQGRVLLKPAAVNEQDVRTGLVLLEILDPAVDNLVDHGKIILTGNAADAVTAVLDRKSVV